MRKAADSLAARIAEKGNPAIASLNWTLRRSRIAASMQQEADHLAEIRAVMYSIADRIETGTLPASLMAVSSKADVETLNSHDEFPRVVIHRSHFQALKQQAVTTREKELVRFLSRAKTDNEGLVYRFSRREINVLDKLVLSYQRRYEKEKGLLRQSGLSGHGGEERERELRDLKWAYEEPKRRLAPYNRLLKMKITSKKAFRQAKRDFESIKPQPTPKTDEDVRQEKIKALEDKVRRFKIPGFFPTPSLIAKKMVAHADINPQHSILEPSAGNGCLADVIAETTHRKSKEIDVIELHCNLREILTLKGYNLVGNDFLECNGKNYDRIIMNPPFEKDQDVTHVLHAYSLLNPHGRLVAIISNGVRYGSTGKRLKFRRWLDNKGGSFHTIPEGSFKSSFIGSGANVVMVVIDRGA